MGLKRRRFSKEFKTQVVRELQAGKSLAQTAREHQLNVSMVSEWRRQYERYGEGAFQGNGHAYTEDARVAELERMVGQLTMENVLLKRGLARFEDQARRAGGNGSGR